MTDEIKSVFAEFLSQFETHQLWAETATEAADELMARLEKYGFEITRKAS